MTKEEYKSKFNEEDAVGWLSIDKLTEKLYPNQEPKHYGTAIQYMLGGEDPLDGVSIYESKNQNDHYHFISYGMSNLYYDLEKCEEEFSHWGFEFTFRLSPFEEDKKQERGGDNKSQRSIQIHEGSFTVRQRSTRCQIS